MYIGKEIMITSIYTSVNKHSICDIRSLSLSLSLSFSSLVSLLSSLSVFSLYLSLSLSLSLTLSLSLILRLGWHLLVQCLGCVWPGLVLKNGMLMKNAYPKMIQNGSLKWLQWKMTMISHVFFFLFKGGYQLFRQTQIQSQVSRCIKPDMTFGTGRQAIHPDRNLTKEVCPRRCPALTGTKVTQ